MNEPPVTAEIYRTAILQQTPRVLSLMDREALSPTAGCCDRTYWAWKFVDFPRSRFQEALCVLGFLYATPFPGNLYHRSPRLLEWIGLGLRSWSGIQHRDGGFDEAYPYERSLAATAFTSFYVGEALTFLGDALPREVRTLAQDTMVRAGEWLRRNDETHGFLSNHLAAAAAALYHVYRVTGDETFRQRSDYFLERILNHQSVEGWYEEYGGADPGYQTHGSFYLSRLWQLARSEQLLESLGRSMTFLAHFVHPDGSLGGEYASRNTQTYYPAAFEMLSSVHPAAAWIAETMRASVPSGRAAGLRAIDAYNFFPVLNNLVFAYLACAEEGRATVKAVEPASGPGIVNFSEAGIIRVRKSRYDAFVGTTKGGVVKLFDRSQRKLLYSDCGYVGRLAGGRRLSSQQQDGSRPTHVEADRIQIEGDFFEVSRPTMTPLRFVAFRLTSLSLGRLPMLARWLKKLLVRVLIHRKRRLPMHLRRTIELGETHVSVRDILSGSAGDQVESLRWGELFTTIHMGSSRYFVNNELMETSLSSADVPREVETSQIASGLELTRTVRFADRLEGA